MITFEWCSQLAYVLRDEAGQWNGQVKSHTDSTATPVREPVHQLIRLFPSLSRQDFLVLQRRCVDGREAV